MATTAIRSTGRRSRSGLTPHARRATPSRSPESRPRAIRRPDRKAIGMVTPSPDGRSKPRSKPTVGMGTPLARSPCACRSIGWTATTNVKRTSARQNGGRVSRMTYRSSVRKVNWPQTIPRRNATKGFGASGPGRRAHSIHRRPSLAKSITSDNKCYVYLRVIHWMDRLADCRDMRPTPAALDGRFPRLAYLQAWRTYLRPARPSRRATHEPGRPPHNLPAAGSMSLELRVGGSRPEALDWSFAWPWGPSSLPGFAYASASLPQSWRLHRRSLEGLKAPRAM